MSTFSLELGCISVFSKLHHIKTLFSMKKKTWQFSFLVHFFHQFCKRKLFKKEFIQPFSSINLVKSYFHMQRSIIIWFSSWHIMKQTTKFILLCVCMTLNYCTLCCLLVLFCVYIIEKNIKAKDYAIGRNKWFDVIKLLVTFRWFCPSRPNSCCLFVACIRNRRKEEEDKIDLYGFQNRNKSGDGNVREALWTGSERFPSSLSSFRAELAGLRPIGILNLTRFEEAMAGNADKFQLDSTYFVRGNFFSGLSSYFSMLKLIMLMKYIF